MSKINFFESNNKYEFSNVDNKINIKEFLEKYTIKSKNNLNDLLFLYNGKYFDLNKIKSKSTFFSKNKNIFVYKINTNSSIRYQEPDLDININADNDVDIITCEKCFEIPKIEFYDKDKVRLYCNFCRETKIKEYSYFNKTNSNKIHNLPMCTFNKEHKSQSIKYCVKCTKYLCKECIPYHKISFEGKNHVLINQRIYNKYYCNEDGHRDYILNRYCKECEVYLCPKCSCSHEDSSIYLFDDVNKRIEINTVLENIERTIKIVKEEEDIQRYFES